MAEQPQPLVFHAKVTVPQNTVQDQQEDLTVAQIQTDLQAGLDGDTSLPAGSTVEVRQD